MFDECNLRVALILSHSILRPTASVIMSFRLGQVTQLARASRHGKQVARSHLLLFVNEGKPAMRHLGLIIALVDEILDLHLLSRISAIDLIQVVLQELLCFAIDTIRFLNIVDQALLDPLHDYFLAHLG